MSEPSYSPQFTHNVPTAVAEIVKAMGRELGLDSEDKLLAFTYRLTRTMMNAMHLAPADQ